VTLDDGGANALAPRVRIALESADISQFGELLDPNVRWGRDTLTQMQQLGLLG
jgi:hypothetical protein